MTICYCFCSSNSINKQQRHCIALYIASGREKADAYICMSKTIALATQRNHTTGIRTHTAHLSASSSTRIMSVRISFTLLDTHLLLVIQTAKQQHQHQTDDDDDSTATAAAAVSVNTCICGVVRCAASRWRAVAWRQ